MGVHFIGCTQDGVLARFTHQFNDDEFHDLIDRVGGFLPPGWKAWHLEDGELERNSKRVQAIAKRIPSVIMLYGAQPTKQWVEIMLGDDVRKFKEKEEGERDEENPNQFHSVRTCACTVGAENEQRSTARRKSYARRINSEVLGAVQKSIT